MQIIFSKKKILSFSARKSIQAIMLAIMYSDYVNIIPTQGQSKK